MQRNANAYNACPHGSAIASAISIYDAWSIGCGSVDRRTGAQPTYRGRPIAARSHYPYNAAAASRTLQRNLETRPAKYQVYGLPAYRPVVAVIIMRQSHARHAA